jgi:hypothetical protein
LRIVLARTQEDADAPYALALLRASGHAAAPPSNVMNSRRLVQAVI